MVTYDNSKCMQCALCIKTCHEYCISLTEGSIEIDTFPYLIGDDRPGIVSFTATRWRQLLNQKKMPNNETALSAVDCYRFVLSNPSVDVCMIGARSLDQMRENLRTLELSPFNEDELSRIKKIGDYLYKSGWNQSRIILDWLSHYIFCKSL